jgi:hypothetical protein
MPHCHCCRWHYYQGVLPGLDLQEWQTPLFAQGTKKTHLALLAARTSSVGPTLIERWDGPLFLVFLG